jgi:hypothetical protein
MREEDCMKILELFAGSRSISSVAEKMGFEVFTTDIELFEKIDYVVDILDFDISKVPFRPDIIWASPPCTGFSVASVSHHWIKNNGFIQPKSDTARLGIKMVLKTLEIISYFNPKYWFIENPRAMLRKMPFMEKLKRHTVTYCQYGDKRMKPTDIWTNSDKWIPRPMCKNGDSCHESAPRGSKTGTQGRKNAYERSKIPKELCLEIINSCRGE